MLLVNELLEIVNNEDDDDDDDDDDEDDELCLSLPNNLWVAISANKMNEIYLLHKLEHDDEMKRN